MSAHVRSVYGIKILKRKHRTLKTLSKQIDTPTLYGHQVWQSSFVLMEYLEENPLAPLQRVMDIGCGWGLLGIFCAKRFACESLLVDADSNVFPYVNSHEQLNDVRVNTIQASFDQITPVQLGGQDVIVGSDICFWPQLATQLRLLIEIALKNNVKKIILADPGRQTFMHLAEFCKIQYGATLLLRSIIGRTKSRGYLLVIENYSRQPLAA